MVVSDTRLLARGPKTVWVKGLVVSAAVGKGETLVEF